MKKQNRKIINKFKFKFNKLLSMLVLGGVVISGSPVHVFAHNRNNGNDKKEEYLQFDEVNRKWREGRNRLVVDENVRYLLDNATMTATVIGLDTTGQNMMSELMILGVLIQNETRYRVTEIRNGAFRGCRSLRNIVIPNSVEHIGYWAFKNCSADIKLPEGKEAYLDKEYERPYVGLIKNGPSENVYLLKSKEIYKDETGITYELNHKDKTAKIIRANKDIQVSNLVIDTVEFGGIEYIIIEIREDAFENCSGLTGSLTIKGNVTSIGEGAFSQCSSLTNIFILGSVTSIEEYAFYNCSSLESVVIPDSVKSIEDYAFNGCSSLIKVNIPDSVESIGDHAFCGCSKLMSIDIPDGVTEIGDYAFSKCSLTNINIPKGVTEIGAGVFYRCKKLTEVKLKEGVTSIGEWAFSECSLTNINIPKGVTSIEEYAFANCSSLKSIVIPDSVESIGDNAFCGCSKLMSIDIPDGVTEIGPYAFCGCSILNRVIVNGKVEQYIFIPDSVEYIGKEAFEDCGSLVILLSGNKEAYLDEECTIPYYGPIGRNDTVYFKIKTK